MPPISRPYCLHLMPRINKCEPGANYVAFQARLNIVFRTIFDGIEIPPGHNFDKNDVVLLKLVHLLITSNDVTKINTFFTDLKTQTFIRAIAHAFELDQWHDFQDASYARINKCGELGLVKCIFPNTHAANIKKGALMEILEETEDNRANIRKGEEQIDGSNNDPAKSFYDAQYTIIDTMPTYLKKIVDTNLIELKTAAYYIDSAPCAESTDPNQYNTNQYKLNTSTEFFIVNCALAFYQSFFISLNNFVFTIYGMNSDDSDIRYNTLKSFLKRYIINIKYINPETGVVISQYNYIAEGGAKGHFTVPNVVKILVCTGAKKAGQGQSKQDLPINGKDAIENLIIWLEGLTSDVPAIQNFLVSFLTLNKGFGDFVQMFMCLYLFYIEITINIPSETEEFIRVVLVFLYNIILATCDSHLTYIALICKCPFIIGGLCNSRKIYMDGKSRYLTKTFKAVWNSYNKIHIVTATDSIPEIVPPIWDAKKLKDCGCSGKSSAVSTSMSLTSISTFESNNKGRIKFELDRLRAYAILKLYEYLDGTSNTSNFELTIGTKIKLFPGIHYELGNLFIINIGDSIDAFVSTLITDETLLNYQTLYKTLSINVDTIITSIAYINFLYEMFYGNRTILINIKSSLRDRVELDIDLFEPFTLANFISGKSNPPERLPRMAINRFAIWAYAIDHAIRSKKWVGMNIQSDQNFNNFYDYVIQTLELLKALDSYNVAIDEYIYKLTNFPNLSMGNYRMIILSLGEKLLPNLQTINHGSTVMRDYIYSLNLLSGGTLYDNAVLIHKVLTQFFSMYKEMIITEIADIYKTYFENIDVCLFFYYLPEQINQLELIMNNLNVRRALTGQSKDVNADEQLGICSVAIKCFQKIIESHKKIKSYQNYGGTAVPTAAIQVDTPSGTEDKCVNEDEGDEDDDEELVKPVTDFTPSIDNLKTGAAEEKMYPSEAQVEKIKTQKAAKSTVSSSRSGKRRRTDDDTDNGDSKQADKKVKNGGGYYVSNENGQSLSLDFPHNKQLKFSVANVEDDEHYYIDYIELTESPSLLGRVQIVLDFSLSELIYSIKEQSIYDEDYKDPLHKMINSMYKLLAFTEFILYKNNPVQTESAEIITLTEFRYCIEQILNDYHTAYLNISSKDDMFIGIAQNSLVRLDYLLSISTIFLIKLTNIISRRCGGLLSSFHEETKNFDTQLVSLFESMILEVVNNYSEDSYFEIRQNNVDAGGFITIETLRNYENASKFLIFYLGYEIIKNTGNEIIEGIRRIKEILTNQQRMSGGIYKNKREKRAILYKKIQDVRENITGYVSKNTISRNISILKPSKQIEKPTKPSKQIEKSPKPSKQIEKSPKPSKQPEKLPKPSKQIEKSPKPSKQPEKLPKPSKQPEQIKVTDNNNQNISKYKLRVEQFKNKKFSAYFEKKLKTYLNDKNINIYKIGIMKMRGILKNIYKLD